MTKPETPNQVHNVAVIGCHDWLCLYQRLYFLYCLRSIDFKVESVAQRLDAGRIDAEITFLGESIS